MTKALAAIAVVLTLAAAFCRPVRAGETMPEAEKNLGFWNIGVTDFAAETPIVVRNPAPESGSDFYYVWPFTFRNTISLTGVLDYMKELKATAGASDEDLSALLDRLIERLNVEIEEGPNKLRITKVLSELKAIDTSDVPGMAETVQQTVASLEKELERGANTVPLYASIVTDTQTTTRDVSNPIVRNIAERILIDRGVFGGLRKPEDRFHTTLELGRTEFPAGARVFGVAVFPQIDPRADSFEVRIHGLGRRVMPSYYPGHLLKVGLRPEAKLRRVLRYLYLRPGDPYRRQMDKVVFDRRLSEWEWIWPSEIYPDPSQELVMESTVTTDEGEKRLAFAFRYFPYEVFNSTPDPQKITVRRAGFAFRLRWHGLDLPVTMMERTGDVEYRYQQALRRLAAENGDLFPQGTEARHVDGTVAPGRKAAGVAVVRWGIDDAAELLKSVTIQLRAIALTARESDKQDALVAALLAQWAPEETKAKLWERKPLPDDAAMQALVLAQAEKDLGELGVEATEDDLRRYGDHAPFAALVNAMAAQELERIEGLGQASVAFEAEWSGGRDSAQFVRLTAPEYRPKETQIDVSVAGSAAPIETGPAITDTILPITTPGKAEPSKKTDGGKTEAPIDIGW